MNFFDFTDKTVLITGASSGLGRSMAIAFGAAGSRVLLLGRNKEQLKKTHDIIIEGAGQAEIFSVDLQDQDSIQAFIRTIENEVIDVLINNAGIAGLTPILDDDNHLGIWDSQYATNVRAVWSLTKHIANKMILEKVPGSIINISSINGGNAPFSGAASYASTKAAVVQMTRVMSGELAKHNIRVNVILPGLFRTELTAEKISKNEEGFKNTIPLGFIANPEDINGVVLFLASNTASRYVTGSEFVVDGGISANCIGA